jgi:hypothetical protein
MVASPVPTTEAHHSSNRRQSATVYIIPNLASFVNLKTHHCVLFLGFFCGLKFGWKIIFWSCGSGIFGPSYERVLGQLQKSFKNNTTYIPADG